MFVPSNNDNGATDELKKIKTTSKMKTQSNTYKVAYTKRNGQLGSIIVKSNNEDNAIKCASYHCFTGSDFRNAEQIDNSLYVKPSQQGFQGSDRSNK